MRTGAGDDSPAVSADDLVGDWVPAVRPDHPAPVDSAAAGSRRVSRRCRGTSSAADGADLFDLDDGIDDVAPRPRRRRSKLTTALAAVALVAAGGIAGIAVDQRWGPDASEPPPGSVASRGRPGAAGQTTGGTGQAGAAGRGPVRAGAPEPGPRARPARAPGAGTVVGSAASAAGPERRRSGGWPASTARRLVVTANDGSEVKVDTKGATITQPAPIAVSALTAGELVIVQGTTNADGTVTATQVTARQRRQRAARLDATALHAACG